MEALPTAVYIADAGGVLTFNNATAAELWGERPPLGAARWSGAWRLYRRDGTPLPDDQCALAVAIRAARPLRGQVALAERCDGTRVTVATRPSPQLDHDGRVVEAVDMLVDDARGFSLTLIESAIRRQLCGSGEMQGRPGASEVRIRVPAEELSRS